MNLVPLRAARRVAYRTARRNPGRALLVIAMVALPVALATSTATIARTTVGTGYDEVAATTGSADLLLAAGRKFEVGRLEQKLPADSRAVVLRSENPGFVQQGELFYSTLVEPDPSLDSPVLKGLYELASGDAPRSAGEAAVNPRLLEAFEASLGDDIELGDHVLTVTGLIKTRDLSHPVAVVGRGTLGGFDSMTQVLIDLPGGASPGAVARRLNHHGVTTRAEVAAMEASDAATWDAVSLVGGVLGLFATGLIAAAAFVVGARRQLRELGLIGAVGGESRHVRAVVWLGGTTLGLLGGIVGAGGGVALAFAIHPHLARLVGREVGPLDLNPVVLLAVVLMGSAAATLAALAPARAAGKVSVVSALAGLSSAPRPPGRIAFFGLIVLGMGTGTTAWASFKGEDELLAVGLVAMLAGILLAIPLLVSLMGRLADHLPTALRLAARDSARHGRRTGAAVAAAVIALAVPVAVSSYSLSEERYERSMPRLDPEHLLIGRWSEVATTSIPRQVADEVLTAFPGSSAVPLTYAVASRRPNAPLQSVSAFGASEEVVLESGAASSTLTAWQLFVGDEELLRTLHASGGGSALTQGQAVVLGGYGAEKGFVRLSLPGRRQSAPGIKVPAIAVDSRSYFNESIPRIVISAETAASLGLETETTHYLVTTPEAVSSEDVARAREIAAAHPGYFINSAEDYFPEYALGRRAATFASVPLALAILAVAVALVTSESRRSHQILVAVGAGPLAHRKVVASTALLLAVTTALLAVPAGLLPTIVVQLANQSGRSVVVPWATIGIVVLAAPLLSGAVGALVSRTPKLGSLLTPAS